MLRFYTVTLFSFDFPLNFLKPSPAAHYVACSFLRAQRTLGSEKSPCFFPNVWFDPGSSIKPLSRKIEKRFSQVGCDFTPASNAIIRANLKRIN